MRPTFLLKKKQKTKNKNKKNKMASYSVSVARPQGDTRRVNNPKETVNSLSADRIRLFKGKHTALSTECDT